jgi:hypothetical protein
MKKALSVSVIFLLFMLFSGCSVDEPAPRLKQKVVFTFTVSDDNAQARLRHEIHPGSKILVSINNASGKVSLTHHPLGLTKVGNSYVSEAVELAFGRYTISDFFVVNSSMSVLYATPKRKAPLSNLVSHPVPYSFTVAKAKVASVSMQVVSTANQSPSAFGYVSFGVVAANTLDIAVFRGDDPMRKLTDALLTLTRDSAMTQDFALEAQINHVPFDGDPAAQYLLTIEKDGYIPYRRLITYNEFKETMGDNTHLEIELTPQGEYLLFNDRYDEFTIIGFNAPGTITVYDPNGERTFDVAQAYDPDDFYSQTIWMTHEYQETADNTVFIKNDLEKVKLLILTDASKLVTKYTPNLVEINLGGQFDTLDFSSNSKLWQIVLTQVVCETMILPEEHDIQFVALYYHVSNVPYLIKNIHDNAVRKNLVNGSMSLSDLNEDILNSFSPETQAMLDNLRTNYGWAVYQ